MLVQQPKVLPGVVRPPFLVEEGLAVLAPAGVRRGHLPEAECLPVGNLASAPELSSHPKPPGRLSEPGVRWKVGQSEAVVPSGQASCARTVAALTAKGRIPV